MTTTTHVGRSIADRMPVFATCGGHVIGQLRGVLEGGGRAFLASSEGGDGKFEGPDPRSLDALLAELAPDVVLVEADGSRQRPIKAPAEHEPVLPHGVAHVIAVAGLDAIGRRIDSDAVHRPELVAAIHRSDTVTPDLVAAVLTSPHGAMKSVPPRTRVTPLLNKSRGVSHEVIERVVAAVLRSGDRRIVRVAVTDIQGADFAFATALC